MAICKYKRSYDDLTIDELKAFITRLEPTTDISKLKNKATLKMKLDTILTNNPNNSHADNSYFYFEADDENRQTISMDPKAINVEDYDRLRPKNWNFKPGTSEHFEDRLSEVESQSEAHEITAKSEIALSIQSNADRIEDLINVMKSCQNNSNIFREKIKIEYTESLGVPAFIRQIEEWALLNDQDDLGKIRKACACLVLSRDGLAARECLNDDPNQTWAEFKIQLFDILGKDRSHYKKEFKTMTKKPYETYGGFLSRMTLNYKYGRSLDDVKLNEHHKNDIKHAFIDALEHPVKGFVEFEDDLGNVTYENVAKRAMQAHRAHVPNRTEQLCNVQRDSMNAVNKFEHNNSQMREVIAEQTMLKQMVKHQTNMMEKLIELVSNQTMSEKKGPKFNNRPNNGSSNRMSASLREKLSKQICRRFQDGTCTYGDRCWRQHPKN